MKRMRTVTAALVLAAVTSGCSTAVQSGTKAAVSTNKTVPESAEKALSGGVIRAGQAVIGTLQSTAPRLQDGTHFDVWTYTGRAGEEVVIDLASDEFDTYLLVEGPGGTAAQDDDSGEGYNSRLAVRLPAAGEYTILVNTVNPGETGRYALRVMSNTAAQAQSNPQRQVSYAQRYPGGGDPNAKYALVVGINDYPGTSNDLNGPVQDARLMREILIQRLGFKAENVVLLTDGEGNREHIIEAFSRHLGQAGPNGTAVFYYSGHGTQLEENVALTGSLDPENDGVDEALYVWGTGQAGVLLDDELGHLADGLRTERALLIFDACNSGTGTRAQGDGQAKEVLWKNAVSTVDLPDGWIVTNATSTRTAQQARNALGGPSSHVLLAGSRDQEYSFTAGGWPKYGGVISVFTYYLANELEQLTPNTTWEQLMDRVQRQSMEYTQSRYNTVQTPQLEGTRAGTRVLDMFGGR